MGMPRITIMKNPCRRAFSLDALVPPLLAAHQGIFGKDPVSTEGWFRIPCSSFQPQRVCG
jgi:hypothetical protein